MKTLCFALILSQTAVEDSAPPPHIQNLLKKRILYQIKQSTPEKEFSFDDSTCSVVGLYEYNDDALRIYTSDKAVDLHLAYSDVLAGKKLELSAISNSIDTRANIVAAATTTHEATKLNEDTASENGTKKWLPWIIVGAAGLALGGYAVYKSAERKGGESPAPPSRRPR